MKIFIAGVYYGDKSISLGAFTHKDTARKVGGAMQIHNPDLVAFVKPLIVNEFNMADITRMVDAVIEECDEVSA